MIEITIAQFFAIFLYFMGGIIVLFEANEIYNYKYGTVPKTWYLFGGIIAGPFFIIATILLFDLVRLVE